MEHVAGHWQGVKVDNEVNQDRSSDTFSDTISESSVVSDHDHQNVNAQTLWKLRQRRRQSNGSDATEIPPSSSTQLPADSGDHRMCRICFAGAEDEPTLGRLISPCKCKGTMRYVHLQCLNRWRIVSRKKTSFFQCDECKYSYSFHRTSLARVFSNPIVLTAVTLLIFFVSIFIGGFIAKVLLFLFDVSPNSTSPLYAMTHQPFHQYLLKAILPLHYDYYDDEDIGLDRAEPVYDKPSFLTSILTIDFSHFAAGFSLVGLFGLMQLLLSSLLIPFHSPSWWGGGGLRVRSVSSSGRIQGGSGGSLFWVIFITIGAMRALWSTWKAVRSMARRWLERLELVILEVEED